MNKQSFALLFTGIIGAATLTLSVQAQTKQSITPKFISAKTGGFKFDANVKPFIPDGLGRSAKPDEGDSRGIVSDIDNRIPMLSKKYPWSAIGRVKGTTTNAESYHCTGTLIGEDLVLTNAHCVIDPETKEKSAKIQFMPNVIDGKYQDVAEVVDVIYGTDFKQGDQISPNDWAIMTINKPLGRKYGFLGMKPIPTSTLINNPRSLFFVGYSKDFPTENYQKYLTAGKGWTASYEKGCSITKEEAGFLFHDCATAGGSSGGALIGIIGGEPYILALNNAELGNITNFAVKISTIQEDLSQK
ncbi:trypsin-like serine peptidase [Calothrix sp. PCC 6303]|uniref:trypsin-like serine peptidase n=1 Tax=Calothrix sp. PCC 6303 TaxID=1170562 RepID=UPI0002A0342E|nr:trypsin-like serine protease [Calothrix sp. PCC 6303]AFZ01955.1 peptidase S1 and S6 chymotrypsin/Hap [Calothrix sp. PCC 6303]